MHKKSCACLMKQCTCCRFEYGLRNGHMHKMPNLVGHDATRRITAPPSQATGEQYTAHSPKERLTFSSLRHQLSLQGVQQCIAALTHRWAVSSSLGASGGTFAIQYQQSLSRSSS